MLTFEVIKYAWEDRLAGETSDRFGWISFIFMSRGHNQSSGHYAVHSNEYCEAGIGHSGQVERVSTHMHGWQ